jgi:putative membrane protein
MIKTFVFAAVAWLSLTVLPVVAQQQRGYHGGPGMMWDGGWGGMFMWPIMMIIFVGGVVVLVVLAIRWLAGGGTHHGGQTTTPAEKTPLGILEERFARGEIDKDEFEERRRVLEK